MKLKSCMYNDIKMMIFNKRYFMILCFLIIVFSIDSVLVYNVHLNFKNTNINLFDIVFLGNINGNFGTSFHLLMPLLSVYPISNYIYQEKKSNYYTQIISRSGRMNYHLSKYFTSFMTGFTLVSFALILNLALSIILLKNGDLYSSEMLFRSGSAFEDIFHSNIILYYILYIVLRSITAGLIASSAYLLNSILEFKNEILVLLTPMILFTLQSIIMTFVSPYHDILQIIQINTRYALAKPVTNILITQVFGFWVLLSFVVSSVAYLSLKEAI